MRRLDTNRTQAGLWFSLVLGEKATDRRSSFQSPIDNWNANRHNTSSVHYFLHAITLSFTHANPHALLAH